MGLHVDQVCKSFAGVHVITDLSMEVREGSIFGFLGPNGAGKTTTMRMILDILRPDSGQITWNGQDVSLVPRRMWGYLPEERGLYPKVEVAEQLLFLARLYGLSKSTAHAHLDEWLDRFQVAEYRHKKVEELSRGNQQKIQFLATILHDPQVLIMDEPFSGLDPLNAQILKEAIEDMHGRGKTILFSTHQLEQVEELCQDVVIIHQGCSIVAGSVREVKRQHGRNVVRLKFENDPEARWLDAFAGVQVARRRQDYLEVHLPTGLNPDLILKEALARGSSISRFELTEPSLTDIFIEHVARRQAPGEMLEEAASSPGRGGAR